MVNTSNSTNTVTHHQPALPWWVSLQVKQRELGYWHNFEHLRYF
jgi:chitinase